MSRYATTAAFKQAVENRLRAASSSGADFARRRQLLVFDRFLARIVREFGDATMLKGGLVVELRVDRARTTKDIDLRMVGSPDALLDRLRRAAALELGDFMVFVPTPTSGGRGPCWPPKQSRSNYASDVGASESQPILAENAASPRGFEPLYQG